MYVLYVVRMGHGAWGKELGAWGVARRA